MDVTIYGIAMMVLTLAVIAALVPVAGWVRLPYTVVLALAGLLLGTLHAATGAMPPGLQLDSYDMWFLNSLMVSSNSIITIFLPPLLMEVSMQMNVRRLFDDLALVLLMAVVAVVTATAAVGLSVLPFADISLLGGLILGAIISTTDPGAVVTTFRELGAPRRLLVILEGESLLNDAAAIAILGLLTAMAIEHKGFDLIGPIEGFFHAFAVGGAVGIALAYVVARATRWMGGLIEAEVTLTVALAYGAYLAAEVLAGASGVVAVVFAGLTLSISARERMGPGNWERLAATWSQIGFWANAFILLIAAVLVPRLLAELSLGQITLLIAIIVGTFASRALVLFGMLPGLSLLGLTDPMSRPQKTLIWWGGVRGAVALVLALGVSESPALPPDERNLIAALACGYTFWTLIVNASTLKLVTRRLGLNRLSLSDLALRDQLVSATLEDVSEYVDALARGRDSSASTRAALEVAYRQRREQVGSEAAIPFGERLRLGLTILCNQEARLVRRQFEAGATSGTEARILRIWAERLADATRASGRYGYDRAMRASLEFPHGFRIALLLHRRLRIDRPMQRLLGQRFSLLMETEATVRELIGFCDEHLADIIGPDAAGNLNALLQKRLELVEGALDAIELQYPAYARRMRRTLLLRAGLRREQELYERYSREGVIGPELHRTLAAELKERKARLATLPRLDLGLESEQLVGHVQLFRLLGEKERRAIAKRMKSRLAAPGEVIVQAGQSGSPMFFVASGVLEVRGLEQPLTLTTGDFFGELGLFAPNRRRSTDVVARAFCRLLFLERGALRKLARRNPELVAQIREAAEQQISAGFLRKVGEPARVIPRTGHGGHERAAVPTRGREPEPATIAEGAEDDEAVESKT